MKRFFKFGLLIITAIFIIGCSIAFSGIQASLSDLSGKPDGIYRGEYSITGTPVSVALDVLVQNGQITEINITKHSCSPIGKQAEKIIPQIIKHQSLEVDVVSGATASSKGILKAVENALQ